MNDRIEVALPDATPKPKLVGSVGQRITVPACALLALIFVISVIYFADGPFIPDPLGGPVPELSRGGPDKDYVLAMSQIVSNLCDNGYHAILAAFVILGFALRWDKEHRNHALHLKMKLLIVMASSAVLSFVFLSHFEYGFFIQVFHDRLDPRRLEPTFNLYLICLGISVLVGFTVVGFSFGRISEQKNNP